MGRTERAPISVTQHALQRAVARWRLPNLQAAWNAIQRVLRAGIPYRDRRGTLYVVLGRRAVCLVGGRVVVTAVTWNSWR